MVKDRPAAIALQQITYRLLLLSRFSLRLVSVLTGLGLVAVYGQQQLEKSSII